MRILPTTTDPLRWPSNFYLLCRTLRWGCENTIKCFYLPCAFIAPPCYLSDGCQPPDGCEPSHDYGTLLLKNNIARVGEQNNINSTMKRCGEPAPLPLDRHRQGKCLDRQSLKPNPGGDAMGNPRSAGKRVKILSKVVCLLSYHAYTFSAIRYTFISESDLIYSNMTQNCRISIFS